MNQQSRNLNLFQYTQSQSGFLITFQGQPKSQIWIDINKKQIIECNDESSLISIIILFLDSQQALQLKVSEQQQIGSFRFSIPLGIFSVLQKNYLVLCEECKYQVSILQEQVYLIEKVLFIPFTYSNYQTNDPKIVSIKKFLESGFYFSINGDITRTVQNKFLRQNTDPIFCWNQSMIQNFIDQEITPRWIYPIIYGFVTSYQTIFTSQTCQLTLISRVSCKQISETARGIDDDGNVSHFVETEFILVNEKFLFSYVAVRGTVPVFWQQLGMSHATKISKTYDVTQKSFQKHFQLLIKNYGSVHCVNLLGKSKDEQSLTIDFENQLKSQSSDQVTYEKLDFKTITNSVNFEKLNPFIRKLEPYYFKFKMFCLDLATNQIMLQQVGVFRINCLLCIDKIFMIYLEQAFQTSNLDATCIKGEILNSLDDNKKSQIELIRMIKNMWADLLDNLSQLYTGTTSPYSYAARGGKTSAFQGFLNQRFNQIGKLYHETFEGKSKWEVISLLLQNNENNHLKDFLEKKSEEFKGFKKLYLQIFTWNVGGKTPNQLDLTKSFFNFDPSNLPDIVIVGIQEMINLNPKNVVINSTEEPEKQWNKIVQMNLLQYYQYLRVESGSLVGLFLTVFAKQEWIDRIRDVQFDSIKTGFQGTLGNKGAISIRFYIDDTQMVFTNAHLSSGQKKIAERVEEIKDIHDRAFQGKNIKNKEQSIQQSDYRIFFGDLNFRLEQSLQEVNDKINTYKKLLEIGDKNQAAQILDSLLQRDQLNQIRKNNFYLNYYDESQICFLPTYKYGIQNQILELINMTVRKNREFLLGVIVYYLGQKATLQSSNYPMNDQKEKIVIIGFYYIQNIIYNRPVTSLFLIDILKIDEEKKLEAKKLYHLISKQEFHNNLKRSQSQRDEQEELQE